jgi:hypothetical protein
MVDTLARIQGALESAGVVFIPADHIGGPGVRLREAPAERAKRRRQGECTRRFTSLWREFWLNVQRPTNLEALQLPEFASTHLRARRPPAKSAALILVTNNEKEFKRIAGLKVQNWAKPN